MSKINLRDISSRAKQWDHPAKGLFKYAESMKVHGGDILKIPKKDRERYCVSLVALAMMNDSKIEWWTNVPIQDPPDRTNQGSLVSRTYFCNVCWYIIKSR